MASKRQLVRATLWLALIGATVGPMLDGLHTFSGATWYPHPQWLRSVWWCPPLFSFAAVAIGMSRVYWEQALKRPGPTLSWSQVLGAMGVFVACYAASGFLPVSEAARAVLLTVCFTGAWLAWDRTALGIACALAAGGGGWLVEHTLVGQGLFFHRETTLDGIALWLPALYFSAALAIGALARRLSA
jgi:hypothetical protein